MMGGLHIEIISSKLCGDLLCNSGWTNALIQADVVSSGKADALLTHVTRTRYADQVTACALYVLQRTDIIYI